jgi:hypothetical protein
MVLVMFISNKWLSCLIFGGYCDVHLKQVLDIWFLCTSLTSGFSKYMVLVVVVVVCYMETITKLTQPMIPR